MEICKICGRELNSVKSLTLHVNQTHKVNIKNYYDTL